MNALTVGGQAKAWAIVKVNVNVNVNLHGWLHRFQLASQPASKPAGWQGCQIGWRVNV
jgi:hypothetical protein